MRISAGWYEAFQSPPSIYRAPRANIPARRLGPNLTEDEVAYCESRLRELYHEWPRFHHLTFEGSRWVAKFQNCPEDQNPSSILREDFTTIRMVGKGSEGPMPKPLRSPLNLLMRFWVEEHRVERDGGPPVTFQEVLLEVAPRADMNPWERQFQDEVTDADRAREEMQRFFRQATDQHALLFVKGPEGIGKSSALMADHHRIIAELERTGESSLAMYAFGNYREAEKKCAAFNLLQSENGFVGVILPSFTRAYKGACEALGIQEITDERAARAGFVSRWAAIEKLQPGVIERFKMRHELIWKSVGEKRPVWFTAHQVAHQWQRTTPSRLMWSREFWARTESNPDHMRACREDTTLGLLVHDEVKIESLVEARPSAVLEWVKALVDSWTEHSSLPERWNSYEAFVTEVGFPDHHGETIEVSFDEAQRLGEMHYSQWDHVTTGCTQEYVSAELTSPDESEGGTHDIYAARHGREWYVIPLLWWQRIAHRVVMLTTESIPTAIARVADPDWAVFELETPKVPRDSVETYPSRFVTGDNLLTLCSEYREKHSEDDLFVISNKVAMLANTMTHAGARGSNDLIGRNVLQTMTFMTPDEYERLQALNAWTGRSDLVSLRHIDEFNQTAGRNLGFRKQGGVKHVLLVNRRLFGLLLGPALEQSRYDFRVQVDKHQRYEIKRAAG